MNKNIIFTALLAVGIVAGGQEVSADEANHTVISGDTLGEIAKDNETSVQSLLEVNPKIGDPNLIFPNQTVILPGNGVVQEHFNVISNVEDEPSVVSSHETSHEIEMLQRLVEAESKGEPYVGKVAVAKVVLNRVANGSFPNSIQAVVNQPGQFDPVANGSIHGAATDETVQAVDEALTYGGNANGAVYFYNPAIADGQSWFNTLETIEVIGNHVFKR